MFEAFTELKDGIHATIREEVAKIHEEAMDINSATLKKVTETAEETKVHIEKATTEWTTVQRKVSQSTLPQASVSQPRWSDVVASGALVGANSRVAARAAIAARQIKGKTRRGWRRIANRDGQQGNEDCSPGGAH